ncbi:hypothetical protein D9M68_965980 [compost metagenome]
MIGENRADFVEDRAGEALLGHRCEDGGNLELSGGLGHQGSIVAQRYRIYRLRGEGHLRLVIDHDQGVVGRAQQSPARSSFRSSHNSLQLGWEP